MHEVYHSDRTANGVLKTDFTGAAVPRRRHSFPRSDAKESSLCSSVKELTSSGRQKANFDRVHSNTPFPSCLCRRQNPRAGNFGAYIGQEFAAWYLCNQGVRHGLRLSATRLDVLANSRKYLYLDCEPFRQVLREAVGFLGLLELHAVSFSREHLCALKHGDLGGLKYKLRKCYAGISRIRELLCDNVTQLGPSSGSFPLRLPQVRRLLQLVRRKLLADLSKLIKVMRTAELIVLRSVASGGRKGIACIQTSGRAFLLSLGFEDMRRAFGWLHGRRECFSWARSCGFTTIQCVRIVRRLSSDQSSSTPLFNCIPNILRSSAPSTRMALSLTREDSSSTRFSTPPSSFKVTDYVDEDPAEGASDILAETQFYGEHCPEDDRRSSEASRSARRSKISKLLAEYLRIRVSK